MNLPRVVALMPTQNRPEMAHRSAHFFLEQIYPGPKTLLVFDDGDFRAKFCPSCEQDMVYVRCERTNLPTKRNRMMEHVGDHDAFYFMWDDDDYHGPNRVGRQVDMLVHCPAVIMRPTLYYNSITRDVRMSKWISDATCAFTWDFWDKRRFCESIDPGSGHLFVNSVDVETIAGELDYMTVVHNGQRHTPPAFGPPDFYDAPVTAEWAEERLRLR